MIGEVFFELPQIEEALSFWHKAYELGRKLASERVEMNCK